MPESKSIRAIPTGKWARARSTGRIAWRLTVSGAGKLVGRRRNATSKLADTLLRELDGMKGMAMKVGQILSYVDAGLPPEVTAKLAKLQEGVTPMPWETIRGVIEAELGPVEELFERIDETPIAAASIGQVHRAVSRGGAQVVVKVRYPGVDTSMNADFAMMNKMAKLAGLFSAVDGKALVEELRERVLEECDYVLEAASQRRFEGLLRADADIVVPGVLQSHCSASVLTTEFIDGQRFGVFIAEATDEARSRAARALFRLNFGPLVRDGVLHADPHPGNQLYLDGGRIAALDFGCIRAFEPGFVELFLRFVDGIVADDRTGFEELAEELGLAPRPDKIDFDAMWGQYRWMFEPLWREGFRFTRDWWLEGSKYTKPTAPNARHQGMPAEWIWLQRVVWGLWAVLLKLDGEADLRAEWLQLRNGGSMPRPFTPDEQVRIRRRLLEAGGEALATTGFRKTTVSQLARASGISKGGFYLFFPDKVALWVELLREAEAGLRGVLLDLSEAADLEAEPKLRTILRAIFDAVTVHPMLRALADPDDLAWLMRSLPPEVLIDARQDDDRFFGALYDSLVAGGGVRSGLGDVFRSLPGAALALAHGRGLVGEDRFDALVDFQIEAWLGRLLR